MGCTRQCGHGARPGELRVCLPALQDGLELTTSDKRAVVEEVLKRRLGQPPPSCDKVCTTLYSILFPRGTN